MAVVEEISTITAKGQTTIPKATRGALGVEYGGTIAFRVDERGVSVHRADVEHEDPILGNFLAFLAKDIEQRPEAIKPLSAALAERVARVARGVDMNVDALINGDIDP